MKIALFGAVLLAAAAIPSPAAAQQANITQTITGTRLDINATGEVSRVPDVAVITAGVVSRSATATGALQDSASKMSQVLSALKRAGVADRDIQTSNVSLNPEYRYPENQSPQLVGYTASNNVTVRFRDIRNSGKILDALVHEGANQINGPSLIVDKPESALDEARAKAIAIGRARADLYARSLGMRVARVVSVSESETYPAPPPMPMYARAEVISGTPATKVVPGEQKLQVNLAMVFELQ
ncbi:MAG: SIMPL domain-containing protein [Sphingomicrobium sp.]